jgi:hypothetical protein
VVGEGKETLFRRENEREFARRAPRYASSSSVEALDSVLQLNDI